MLRLSPAGVEAQLETVSKLSLEGGMLRMSVENDKPNKESEGHVPDESSGVDPVPQQDESEGGLARTGRDEDYEA